MLVARILSIAVALAAAVPFATPAAAQQPTYEVGSTQRSFVDQDRAIKASSGFAGSPVRRLDVLVWYPIKAAQSNGASAVVPAGPWPLIIYSHGTYGRADNAMHLVRELVSHGYVVAATNYPLTSSGAFTKVTAPDVTDVVNQPKDISFIIDRVLADPILGKAVDAKRIGTTGISLGAVTSYFTSFGRELRDPRVKATALLGAGDPVQAALTTNMGLLGTNHAAVSVPTLFVSAQHDVFSRITGRPHAAYSRIEKPKYEVMIQKAAHSWFGDRDIKPADGKNPDCLFFEQWQPGIVMPGCETGVELTDPARQKEITRSAVLNFFDAYLKDDARALERLRTLNKSFSDIELLRDD